MRRQIGILGTLVLVACAASIPPGPTATAFVRITNCGKVAAYETVDSAGNFLIVNKDSTGLTNVPHKSDAELKSYLSKLTPTIKPEQHMEVDVGGDCGAI